MRRPDWKPRLRETIAAAETERFAYGFHDCCQFPARCIAAVTGVDLAARFPRYRGRFDAWRIAARAGGLEALATSLLGAPVAPNLVRTGDLVSATLELGVTLGVCEGDTCAFAAARGLVRRRRDVIRLGWRVD